MTMQVVFLLIYGYTVVLLLQVVHLLIIHTLLLLRLTEMLEAEHLSLIAQTESFSSREYKWRLAHKLQTLSIVHMGKSWLCVRGIFRTCVVVLVVTLLQI